MFSTNSLSIICFTFSVCTRNGRANQNAGNGTLTNLTVTNQKDQNITAEAVQELTTLWKNQRTYIGNLDEELRVIFGTYQVKLKKIMYLVDTARNLTDKQIKIMVDNKWNEEEAENPQPYHDGVIEKLADHWEAVERYFRKNRLKGVDFSLKRINKLLEKAKDELYTRWEKVKVLRTEMETLGLSRDTSTE